MLNSTCLSVVFLPTTQCKDLVVNSAIIIHNDNAINPTVQMHLILWQNYWNEILIVAKLTSYQTHMERTMWLSDKRCLPSKNRTVNQQQCRPMMEQHLMVGILMRIDMHHWQHVKTRQKQQTKELQIATLKLST